MTARRSEKSAAVDDFFDETLLPPPAPGLVMPAAIGHELPPEVSADHAQPVFPSGQAIPSLLPERASQLTMPMSPVSARKATLRFAPLELPVSGAPRHPPAAQTAPAAAPTASSSAADDDTPRSQAAQRAAKSSGQLTRLSLPVLPPPSIQSPAADLRYLLESGLFLLSARRAQAGLRRREAREQAAIDRFLTLTAQTRSRDTEAMRAVETLFFAAQAGQPPVTPQVVATRLEARGNRLLDELRRGEARLGSELRERTVRTRRYQAELDGIDRQLPDVSADLLRRRHELASALTVARRESDEKSHELGSLSVERLVAERAFSLCRRDPKATLKSFLSAQSGQAAGRTALLLFGALIELTQPAARLGLTAKALRTEPPASNAAATPLPPLLPLLALRTEQTRIVAATQSLDRHALRRSLLFLLVMTVTAMLCAGIALWALTGA